MDKPSCKLVGQPCGQHGQYTFYKALRVNGKAGERIIAIGDFFFVRIWQDSELVSIGELQLLWTDRVSDQTLVSLRLYFLPENTPEGRSIHGEDEVLAINDKVVLRADDLLSWISDGTEWRWGLRAVWRGACAPPGDHNKPSAPLHKSKLDFSDVDKEKSLLAIDENSPGVVVFSYPRYCRYRALVSRLEGIQADWLRESLVAALGGYAAPTQHTRILYCRETFEYPELEGHEFVCNQLAPKLKGRPRGRRRRPHSPPDRDSDTEQYHVEQQTPRKHSTRNDPDKSEEEPEEKEKKDIVKKLPEERSQDRAFLKQLKLFYKERNEPFKVGQHVKDTISLRSLYRDVISRGGYNAVCRARGWRSIQRALALRHTEPGVLRVYYERYLLSYENHDQRRTEQTIIDTIEVPESPVRDEINRSPSPTKPVFDPSNLLSLNTETGETEPVKTKVETEAKIAVKPLEKLSSDVPEDLVKKNEGFLTDLAQKYNLGAQTTLVSAPAQPTSTVSPLATLAGVPDKYMPLANGFTPNGPADPKSATKSATRSSLRSVRVKPSSRSLAYNTDTNSSITPLRPDSASSSPPVTSTTNSTNSTNFGINYPPQTLIPNEQSDDEIIEVPYKPKTPEIIDLDEYPESPQSVKKKKLDELKQRGLEVTAVPNWNIPLALNPVVQHQILTQAQLFQMATLPTYPNGTQPPNITQGKSIFGSSGFEKTVYGNPKDIYMPPPHDLRGAPIKPTRNIPPPDILDLTCKEKVEVSRVNTPQSYTLVDGKAVVGSNLEITLVNPKQKPRTPVKRSSNGQFVSIKSTTPKEKKANLVIPSYQAREVPSSSAGYKNASLTPLVDMQKSPFSPLMDPLYTAALYSSLTGPMDIRHQALYREILTNFRGYTGNLGVATPTTKN